MTLALDPTERARRRKRRREIYAQTYQGMGWKTSALSDIRPPDDVLAERDRRVEVPEPILGDPRPGYSAADRQRSGRYTLSDGAMKRHTATLSPPLGRAGGATGIGWVYITLPRITMLLEDR